jgi:hypothetical protein
METGDARQECGVGKWRLLFGRGFWIRWRGAGVRDFYAKGIQDDTIECEEACGGELGVLGGGDAGESSDSAVADEFRGAGEDF